MDRVATPQPEQMPCSPAMMGTPAGRQMFWMISVLEAAVLSVGM